EIDAPARPEERRLAGRAPKGRERGRGTLPAHVRVAEEQLAGRKARAAPTAREPTPDARLAHGEPKPEMLAVLGIQVGRELETGDVEALGQAEQLAALPLEDRLVARVDEEQRVYRALGVAELPVPRIVLPHVAEHRRACRHAGAKLRRERRERLRGEAEPCEA